MHALYYSGVGMSQLMATRKGLALGVEEEVRRETGGVPTQGIPSSTLGGCRCRPPTTLLPMLGLMLTATTVSTRCTIYWGGGTLAVADMVKGCLLFVVVDTECGGCGGLDRQWMAVDDVVKGYLPLPLRSPSSSWSKGMIVVVVNI